MSIIDGVCLKVQWYLGAGWWVGHVCQAHLPESTHYARSLSTDRPPASTTTFEKDFNIGNSQRDILMKIAYIL